MTGNHIAHTKAAFMPLPGVKGLLLASHTHGGVYCGSGKTDSCFVGGKTPRASLVLTVDSYCDNRADASTTWEDPLTGGNL